MNDVSKHNIFFLFKLKQNLINLYCLMYIASKSHSVLFTFYCLLIIMRFAFILGMSMEFRLQTLKEKGFNPWESLLFLIDALFRVANVLK